MATFFSCAVLSLLFCTPVWADEAQEVGRLLKQGQVDAAAARLEAALAKQPKDAGLRFLRGVIQIEQKKTNDAILTFQRMTEDFPELPEPYNNLAVLYAGQGQYDKSRAALELAIRTHPSYATAHENLGDVYAKLASESYNKALQLDAGNNAAQIKLNVIKDLMGGKTVKPSTLEANSAKPAVVATLSPAPSATPAPRANPPVAPVNAPVAVKPAPSAASKPAAAPAEAGGDEAALQKLVRQWAAAWSAKDVDAYLSFYASNFKPSDGASRKAWAVERRDRIEGKSKISVIVENPTVVINENNAAVRFRQGYQADAIKTSGLKVLNWAKSDGQWRIVSERTGS